MTTSEQQWYPKGFFPLMIRVTDRKHEKAEKMNACAEGIVFTAESCLNSFMARAGEKYDLKVRGEDENCGTRSMEVLAEKMGQADSDVAEAMVAVPFPDRELIRVELNIFASEVDEMCGEADRFEFYMQSAF
ncbi:MAG: hypothetical protein Q4P12_01695 [Bacteroidales bacterium]|nr:hypothetical protein [Bacteroidales bacterium]